MLIIDLHTLQTVYILNFIHNIFLYSCRTFNCQNICWSSSTVRQRSTCTYIVIFLNQNLFGQCNKILLHFTCFRSYDDFTVTTLDLTHCNLTVNFRNDSRIRRITCFKQLSNTRKTTRDITRLTYSTRNLHDYFTGFRRNFRFILRFNNDDFTKTGCFIRFHFISNILNYTFEFNLTSCFSYNNGIERVPFSN